jgi:hypothetical protein
MGWVALAVATAALVVALWSLHRLRTLAHMALETAVKLDALDKDLRG